MTTRLNLLFEAPLSTEETSSTKHEAFDAMMCQTISEITSNALTQIQASQTTEQTREQRAVATKYKLHIDFFANQIEDDLLSGVTQQQEDNIRDVNSFKQVLKELYQESCSALSSQKQEVIYMMLLLKLALVKQTDGGQQKIDQKTDRVCNQMKKLQGIATMNLDFSKQLMGMIDGIFIPEVIKRYKHESWKKGYDSDAFKHSMEGFGAFFTMMKTVSSLKERGGQINESPQRSKVRKKLLKYSEVQLENSSKAQKRHKQKKPQS